MTDTPRIQVLSLGGTIVSVPDPRSGAGTLRDGIATLSDQLGGGDLNEHVDWAELATLHSWDMGPEQWQIIAARIGTLQDEGYAGVVVSQGTDTLEETAFALDLLGDWEIPVVVTGAMRLADAPGRDGPANLAAAIRVAADPRARGRGVLVAFAAEVHAAAYVMKTHTTSPQTFQSPMAGPLAHVDDLGIHWLWPAARSVAAIGPGDGKVREVPLLAAAAGAGDLLVRAMEGTAVEGVVVQGFGAGNLPASWQAAIERMIGQGVAVVLTSRCIAGRVLPAYGDAGGGHTLAEIGMIPAGRLAGPKARIALMSLLAAQCDLEQIRQWFVVNGAAEQLSAG